MDRHALSDTKHSMTPVTLETVPLLKINADYWGPTTVVEAIAERVSDRIAR